MALNPWSRVVLVSAFALSSSAVLANPSDSQPAYKINGKQTTMGQLYQEDQASFYEVELKRYENVERLARERYLDTFWQQKAKESGKSLEAARKAYIDSQINITEKAVASTVEMFKDHPQLKNMPADERKKQVRDYLEEKERADVYEKIVQNAMKKGDLVISFPRPQEPVYQLTVTDNDHVRFGPNAEDVKPVSCKADDCAITIIEYSEFECPFCKKVLPDVKRVLTEYKGKIRWIVRDWPLNFHARARPAAIAAKCAAQQGKYWQMYNALFDGQRNLGDEDLNKYATQIGLDMTKYKACVTKPAEVEKVIDENFSTGAKLGVNGTPAFFINGRKLSGALPYDEFKRVIDQELSKRKKS